MKIMVGLGGAPKNPSHGDMVTVAYHSKADFTLTRLCNAYTAQVSTRPYRHTI